MKRSVPAMAALLAAAALAMMLPAYAAVKEGDKMPAIKAQTADGKSISVGASHGQVTIVDLWATWCPPCREAIPHIQAIYDRLRTRGLHVVGVSLGEGREKPVAYARQNKLTYTVAWTTEAQAQTIGQQTGVEAIPTLFVIDRKGLVRLVQTGFEPDTEQKLETLVRKLLTDKA